MGWTEIGVLAALAMAAVSVIMSVQNRQSIRIAEEALRIEERRERREAARIRERDDATRQAHPRPRFQRRVNTRADRLLIENRGPAEAREVEVEIEGVPALEWEFCTEGTDLGFSLPVHGPPAEFCLFQTAMRPTTWTVSLKWVDEAGPHSAEFTIRE